MFLFRCTLRGVEAYSIFGYSVITALARHRRLLREYIRIHLTGYLKPFFVVNTLCIFQWASCARRASALLWMRPQKKRSHPRELCRFPISWFNSFTDTETLMKRTIAQPTLLWSGWHVFNTARLYSISKQALPRSSGLTQPCRRLHCPFWGKFSQVVPRGNQLHLVVVSREADKIIVCLPNGTLDAV